MSSRLITKVAILGTLGGALGVVLSLFASILQLEEDVGLSWLFQHRGERSPPSEVIVVAMDRDSADRLNLSNGLEGWPRSLHTRLIDKLHSSGAKVIVFDVLFKKHLSSQQDIALANEIHKAQNVILFEYLDKELVTVTDTSGGQSGILVEKLVEPIPELGESAVALAPFPLPRVPVKVSQYWRFIHDASDLPTMPVVAFQLYALDAYPDFLSILKTIRPDVATVLPQDKQDVIDNKGLVNFIRILRGLFNDDPELLLKMQQFIDQNEAQFSEQRKGLLRSFIQLYQGAYSQYLNFYGPPRTITTIPYYRILQEDDPSLVNRSPLPDFKDKIVFVGSSEAYQWEQRDGFYSVFTQESGLDISGVEIAATATANLLEGSAIRSIGLPVHIIIVLAWGLLIGVICRWLSSIPALVLTMAGCALYFGYSAYQFSATGLWSPLVIPLLIQAPAILFAGVLWTYIDTNRERHNIHKAFSHYLPNNVVESLGKDRSALKPGGELVYGVCLFTDAAQYTTLSEKMSPEVLGELMNEYYDAIFGPVRRHGGTVSDVVGDAMLAFWVGSETDQQIRNQACAAALEIIDVVDEFNAVKEHQQLPTRLGMHCGELLLGNVGAKDHFEYRVLGDIVNSANRIENMNKHLGTRLLASEEVIAGLDGLLTRELGIFVLAGKSRPIRLYELIARQAQADDRLQQYCQDFESALTSYREQHWSDAISKFNLVIHEYGKDIASQFYLGLCQQYSNTCFAGDWDGRIDMQNIAR